MKYQLPHNTTNTKSRFFFLFRRLLSSPQYTGGIKSVSKARKKLITPELLTSIAWRWTGRDAKKKHVKASAKKPSDDLLRLRLPGIVPREANRAPHPSYLLLSCARITWKCNIWKCSLDTFDNIKKKSVFSVRPRVSCAVLLVEADSQVTETSGGGECIGCWLLSQIFLSQSSRATEKQQVTGKTNVGAWGYKYEYVRFFFSCQFCNDYMHPFLFSAVLFTFGWDKKHSYGLAVVRYALWAFC